MRSGLWAAALLCGALLAGCSGGGKGGDGRDEADFDGLGLEATADTGVIRGIVIDEAVRPIVDVAVSVAGPAGPAGNTTTREDGSFGLDGLAPGAYFVTAAKAGFQSAQTSVEVVAGVAEPDPVKILLSADAAAQPYSATYVMDGFMTCSARVVLTAVPAGPCVSSDVSQTTYELDRVPDWGQSEMTWRSTQALGDAMSLVSECFSGTADDPDPCPDGNEVLNRSEGGSPLVFMLNQTVLQHYRVGESGGNPYRIRVFAAGRGDTDVVNEDQNNQMLNQTTGGLVPCVAWPAINNGCFRFTGVGVILNQAFKVYTTVFYGYAPPEGWLFTASGEVPEPPA